MKKFLSVVLVIVLLAVIGVEAYLLFFQDDAGSAGTQIPALTQSPTMTLPPEPTQAPVTPEPAPTQTPVTPEPAPTQAPATPVPTATPIPTPTPTPAPSDGSFSSDTGTALNLIVSWRSEAQGDGTTRVYVDGKISSYSLGVASTNATISFGGQTTTAKCSAVSIGSDVGKTETSLFSATLDVPSGTTGTMSVDWAFKGSYSGVSLPNINASGEVTA